MKLRFLFAALLMLATTCTRADDAVDCVKTSGDARIAACTRVIESGRWQGAHLAPPYNNRGLAKQDKGDLEGAIADYNRALELNPRYAPAYNNRASAKHDTGDLDGAIADLNRALELDPRDAAAYSNRAAAKGKKGDLDGAIADLNLALNLIRGTRMPTAIVAM